MLSKIEEILFNIIDTLVKLFIILGTFAIVTLGVMIFLSLLKDVLPILEYHSLYKTITENQLIISTMSVFLTWSIFREQKKPNHKLLPLESFFNNVFDNKNIGNKAAFAIRTVRNLTIFVTIVTWLPTELEGMIIIDKFNSKPDVIANYQPMLHFLAVIVGILTLIILHFHSTICRLDQRIEELKKEE